MAESDRQYSAGTVEHNATDNDKLLAADGKKSGHGTIAWLPAPGYVMPEGPDWPSTAPSRVIALLDTGVRQHPWLPELQPGERRESAFLLNAEDYGWQSPVPDDDTGPTTDYSSHWGHATFIAGLIRLAAPGAQVLSMRVMDRQGKVSEDHVVEALTWLADNPELAGGIAVNIVLMAFGRPEDPDDEHLDDLRAPIKRLTDRGVRIVASAGNDGAERPVYPAAFAAESGRSLDSQRPVLSVGALATPTERAPYSNFGPWVREWQHRHEHPQHHAADDGEPRLGYGLAAGLPDRTLATGTRGGAAPRSPRPPWPRSWPPRSRRCLDLPEAASGAVA